MDNKIQSLKAREVQATIDDLNQYLEGNVTAEGLVDTLQDMIKFLNQFIFENKTDNFDLKKYLAEGRLLKEEMSIEDVYNDAQKQVKDIYNIDVPMDVVKQWADNYQFPYSREVDPEDEDQYVLVYDFGTEERGDFMEWLKDNGFRK